MKLENSEINAVDKAAMLDHAKNLITKLESGDNEDALLIIDELHRHRDQTLYHEVGRLTRSLHSAIIDFEIDMTGKNPEELSRMGDASDRLRYVVEMTEKAANKTLDMVEETVPLSKRIKQSAADLKRDWERLVKREMPNTEFRKFYDRMDSFLEQSVKDATDLDNKIQEIVMAQDYQDLTGQVITRVISLVQEVENNLVNLVKMAAYVEEVTGIKHEEIATKTSATDVVPEGPIIDAETRDDAVSSQDEVDDLLSSLGF